MNKAEFINKLKETVNEMEENTTFTKKDVIVIVDALEKVVKDTLIAGDSLTLPGVAKLSVVERSARIGRNPHDGSEIKIPARKAPSIKAVTSLKDAVNQ